MEMRKIKLMFVMLLGGVGAFTYTSDPMEIDVELPIKIFFRATWEKSLRRNEVNVGEITPGMSYGELDSYLKGLFELPLDAKLKIETREFDEIGNYKQRGYIKLWEHPDSTLTRDVIKNSTKGVDSFDIYIEKM